MTDIESYVEIEKKRFGIGPEDATAFCKMADDSSICEWPCPMYQKCWADLHPDEQGYFPWRGEEIKSS